MPKTQPQSLRRLMSSSIETWDPLDNPNVSVRRVGRSMPRIMPNEQGGWTVASRPNPNEGLPEVTSNPGFDPNTGDQGIASNFGPGGFMLGRELAQPEWARWFDKTRQAGVTGFAGGRADDKTIRGYSGPDLYSGPATSFDEMKPGQFLTGIAAGRGRDRGKPSSNLRSSVKALQDTMFEDARREQVGGRDQFRVAEKKRRGGY